MCVKTEAAAAHVSVNDFSFGHVCYLATHNSTTKLTATSMMHTRTEVAGSGFAVNYYRDLLRNLPTENFLKRKFLV